MNSCLLVNIPGLAAHRERVSEPRPFDRVAVERMLRKAIGLLESYYPTGALEWLREMRPEIINFLKACEREVDAAVLTEDMRRVRQALRRYVEAHQRAFRIYQSRDTQGELLVTRAVNRDH